ncbi:iron-sulfur cluster assembly scaffold protein, partial [Legionella pneumophila]
MPLINKSQKKCHIFIIRTKLTVYLKLQGDLIRDVSFVGCGCAISQASASLMTDALKGKSIKEAHE